MTRTKIIILFGMLYSNISYHQAEAPVPPIPKNLFQYFTQEMDHITSLEKATEAAWEKFQYSSWSNHYYGWSALQNKTKEAKSNFWETIFNAIEHNKVDINSTDSNGNTILSTAPSYKVYEKLRNHGAHFQIKDFIRFHPKISISLGCITMIIAYNLYSLNYFSPQWYFDYMQNLTNRAYHSFVAKSAENYTPNDLHSTDEHGRTPLMNYIIAQEKILHHLRDEITNLKQTNEIAYRQTMKEYEQCKNNSLEQIKKLIQQKAPLDTLDLHGNSLLDYCTTKDIYNLLREQGAPFQIKPWIYFYGQLTSLCIVSIAAVSGAIVVLNNHLS